MYRIISEDMNIGKIAESGQCFRLRPQGDGYALVAYGRLLMITPTEDGCVLDCDEGEFESQWRAYFDLDTDYKAIRERVDPKDSYLVAATDYGRGIRILRQEPWETLVSFIISQRKSIPAIRSCIEALSRNFGTQIGEGVYAFPTPSQLAEQPMSALSACGLGYRCDYVSRVSALAAGGGLDFATWDSIDDDALYNSLLSLRGVGAKVADCVMLFAGHRLGAFPRDVWINRIIDDEYGGTFPLDNYKGCAGVVQQYMFFYGRGKAGKL